MTGVGASCSFDTGTRRNPISLERSLFLAGRRAISDRASAALHVLSPWVRFAEVAESADAQALSVPDRTDGFGKCLKERKLEANYSFQFQDA